MMAPDDTAAARKMPGRSRPAELAIDQIRLRISAEMTDTAAASVGVKTPP